MQRIRKLAADLYVRQINEELYIYYHKRECALVHKLKIQGFQVRYFHHLLVVFDRRLIDRCLIFDADTIGAGFGTGYFIAPFYFREAHAAQAVPAILHRVQGREFFYANANGCSGPQKKV